MHKEVLSKEQLELLPLIKLGRGAAALYAEVLLEQTSTICSHGKPDKKNKNSYAIKLFSSGFYLAGGTAVKLGDRQISTPQP